MKRWAALQCSKFARFYFKPQIYLCRKALVNPPGDFKFGLRFFQVQGYLCSANFNCWHCHTEYQSFDYFCPKCSKLQKPFDSVSFFDLFKLSCSFDVNIDNLTKQFRAIQAQLHPDKYSQKGELEQNLSSEYSSLVNKAYSCLQNPLNRAIYMLELNGITIEEDKTEMDKMFLMEIMELNEEIDAADAKKMINLEEENQARLTVLYSKFANAFRDNNLNLAKELVLKIKYFVSIENRIKDLKMKALG